MKVDLNESDETVAMAPNEFRQFSKLVDRAKANFNFDLSKNIVAIDENVRDEVSAESLMLAVEDRDWLRIHLLTQAKCPVDERATAVAARAGDLTMLRLLIKIGAPVSGWTFSYAALTDQRQIVEWLFQEGYRADASAAAHASALGFSELLELLHQHGAHFDEQSYQNAVMMGHEEIADWLVQRGYPTQLEEGMVYTGRCLNSGVIVGIVNTKGKMISSREKKLSV